MEKMGKFSGGGHNGVVSRMMWEELKPEILSLILVRIPVEELLQTIPLVCKSWWSAVAGPYCWSEIDVIDWCRRWRRFDGVDSLVRRLVRRSRGLCRRLSAYRLGDSGFAFAANRVRWLKVLEMPMSEVSNEMMVKHAESLASVTTLDISYCLRIKKSGLEAVGKSCKLLSLLKRNMPPAEMEMDIAIGIREMEDDSEAMAIANTMPALTSLELAHGRFTDSGLQAILTNCNTLTHLDLQGCSYLQLDGDLYERCERIKDFNPPWTYHDDYLPTTSNGDDDDDDEEEEEEEKEGGRRIQTRILFPDYNACMHED